MADIKVYGTLINATPSNKVAYADQVFDEALGKSQAQINQEGAGGARKFRYAHWNIGHFTYYDGIQGSSTPDIPAEDAEAMSVRYRKALNEIDADILGVCEDDPIFDAGGDSSIDMLYYKYALRYQGTKYNYMCASVYANLPLSVQSVTEVEFPLTVQAHRYYKLVVATLNGHPVKIVETHLDWNQGEHGAEYREAQINLLLNTFANDPYVIISADFNVADTDEWDAFAMAGYELANHGYIGDVITWHSHQGDTEMRLDNIVTKGFKMSNIKVHEGTFDLSDHAAISCDLEMIV